MSNHLREDNECQNCGRIVEEVYCPRCGQKNTETRQSFGHLVAHFAEDLTHYDGAFWKTIKYLLFRPAFLTKEYLQGKRQAYVPPVKLYIFIALVTFFIPGLIPGSKHEVANDTNTDDYRPVPDMAGKENAILGSFGWEAQGFVLDNPLPYKSVAEMDSIEALKPTEYRLTGFARNRAEFLIKLYSRNTKYEVGEKIAYSFPKNVSKAMFLYMPLFAFLLWVVHGKKRWYFFDHGIFTLHYFSFLMITTAIIVILFKILITADGDRLFYALFPLILLLMLWQAVYFFRAHRKMYNETFIVSFLKSSLLLAINLVCMVALIIFLLIITLYTLH